MADISGGALQKDWDPQPAAPHSLLESGMRPAPLLRSKDAGVGKPTDLPTTLRTASAPTLGTVLAVLLVLTIGALGVATLGIGGEMLMVTTMLCALLQAALIFGFFMRLVWDRALHAVVILFALALIVLLVTMGLTDRGEYHWGFETMTTDAL